MDGKGQAGIRDDLMRYVRSRFANAPGMDLACEDVVDEAVAVSLDALRDIDRPVIRQRYWDGDRTFVVVRARWEGGDSREYAAAVDGLGSGAIPGPRIGLPPSPIPGLPSQV